MVAREDRCPRCLRSPYRLDGYTYLNRPKFKCADARCGHEWTSGDSGGKYLAHALPEESIHA